MNTQQDISNQLTEQIRDAVRERASLEIRAGGSKGFYGRTPTGALLDVSGHRGIVNYEPTELVMTARAGTPLAEIEAALQEKGQMMPFDPPRFGYGGGAVKTGEGSTPADTLDNTRGGTLGGAISCGLSGSRRPWSGSARDLVLGTRLINGQGELLKFGGEVMKNVAGYDVSRMLAGSMGTLGVITEVSMKVLPRPQTEATLRFGLPLADAVSRTEAWFFKGLPVTGAAHDGEQLILRLAGSESAVNKGIADCGGEPDPDGAAWWQALRDQSLDFFRAPGAPLWRLSLPPLAPDLELPAQSSDRSLYDWNGQLHWLRSSTPAQVIRAAVGKTGGHATLFRGGDRDGEVFQPLSAPVMQLHRRLKTAFDPAGIFNPGRLYATF